MLQKDKNNFIRKKFDSNEILCSWKNTRKITKEVKTFLLIWSHYPGKETGTTPNVVKLSHQSGWNRSHKSELLNIWVAFFVYKGETYGQRTT